MGAKRKATSRPRAKPVRVARVSRSRRRLRLVWLAALVSVTAFLYYRPLASYIETRADLAARHAEVETLRVEKASLEQRLERSTSLDAIRREARRIGYVRPGESLFIVKGIPDWRRTHRSLRGDG